MHLSIVQPLSPTNSAPVVPYDASYQAWVRALDKSLMETAYCRTGSREPAEARRCRNTDNAIDGLDRRVNDQLQRRVVVGLETRILQFEPALFGMGQGFPSCRDAADVMGLPPARKFGTAFAQTRQQVAEGGVAGPQVMCRTKLGHDTSGLI